VSVVAAAVAGRGIVRPDEPVLRFDDEGFTRARAVFETLRVYGGRAFRLDDHLDRIEASAARIGLLPVSRAEWHGLVDEVLGQAALADAALRLYWTAGPDGEGKPTAIAAVAELPDDLEQLRAHGLRLIALTLGVEPDVRRDAPWLLGGVKATNYAINMAADAEARNRGADGAVFLASGEIVLECPVTNIWWRRGRTLFTPSLDLGILAGVTRAVLLEEAPILGYEIREGHFHMDDLASADEAFTSSSVRELMPVVELDDRPVGDGRPGPGAAELQSVLRAAATRR
jgi:4-amino-4-deoxychorismate lyase